VASPHFSPGFVTRAQVPGCILLAVDGEPHTEGAVCWALDLALGLGVALNLVHIRDPYLKQFSNEIYAQGREEYLEHVQRCLEEKALMARKSFESAVKQFVDGRRDAKEPDWTFDVLDGDPAEQLAAHIKRGEHSMLVLGRRRRTRFAALRSRDLAERLFSIRFSVPILVVPEPARDETPANG
jgi:nucleotide-binding universal stress UspA family protein